MWCVLAERTAVSDYRLVLRERFPDWREVLLEIPLPPPEARSGRRRRRELLLPGTPRLNGVDRRTAEAIVLGYRMVGARRQDLRLAALLLHRGGQPVPEIAERIGKDARTVWRYLHGAARLKLTPRGGARPGRRRAGMLTREHSA